MKTAAILAAILAAASLNASAFSMKELMANPSPEVEAAVAARHAEVEKFNRDFANPAKRAEMLRAQKLDAANRCTAARDAQALARDNMMNATVERAPDEIRAFSNSADRARSACK